LHFPFLEFSLNLQLSLNIASAKHFQNKSDERKHKVTRLNFPDNAKPYFKDPSNYSHTRARDRTF